MVGAAAYHPLTPTAAHPTCTPPPSPSRPPQRINLIVKADTAGMVEAIRTALAMLPQLSVTLRFLLTGAGDISVSDVDLAAASGAMVLAFNMVRGPGGGGVRGFQASRGVSRRV